ncbi:MAG TPA: DNA-binding protein WhiA [Candidatus Mediterraneibacter guildfordensis]|nr:DNA-binding protein WhiA [Candidatus Mediterraneibacter guildfordensis]
MSFSGKVREELAGNISSARHCRIAELAAFIGMCGTIAVNSFDQYSIKIHSENFLVARKVFTLIEKTFNIKVDVSIRRNIKRQNATYSVVVRQHEDAVRILQAVKMIGGNADYISDIRPFSPLVLQQTCCRRAFLRGAFQASGSMSDPSKSYHFEIVCDSQAAAGQIQEIMDGFGLDAKIVQRKKAYVAYLKEGSRIVDVLNVMEAHVALMELENVRILKEMRNTVNRKVNCETANINKTVSAAVKQVEDITYLRDTVGFEHLPDNLAEAALARLEHPDATLKELGETLDPPVGKSGINHRLRRLSEMAEKVKQERGGLL